MAKVSAGDRQVFVAIKAWLEDTLELDVSTPVIQGDINRVAEPVGPFILMRRVKENRLNTTIEDYTDTRASFQGSISGTLLTTSSVSGTIVEGQTVFGVGVPTGVLISAAGVDVNHWVLSKNCGVITTEVMRAELAIERFERSVECLIQLDFYGDDAGDYAQTIAGVFRSSEAAAFLDEYAVYPLWEEDAIYAPVVNGEEQYEQRWTVRLHLQYTAVVETVAEFMDTAHIDLVDADKL